MVMNAYYETCRASRTRALCCVIMWASRDCMRGNLRGRLGRTGGVLCFELLEVQTGGELKVNVPLPHTRAAALLRICIFSVQSAVRSVNDEVPLGASSGGIFTWQCEDRGGERLFNERRRGFWESRGYRDRQEGLGGVREGVPHNLNVLWVPKGRVRTL